MPISHEAEALLDKRMRGVGLALAKRAREVDLKEVWSHYACRLTLGREAT